MDVDETTQIWGKHYYHMILWMTILGFSSQQLVSLKLVSLCQHGMHDKSFTEWKGNNVSIRFRLNYLQGKLSSLTQNPSPPLLQKKEKEKKLLNRRVSQFGECMKTTKETSPIASWSCWCLRRCISAFGVQQRHQQETTPCYESTPATQRSTLGPTCMSGRPVHTPQHRRRHEIVLQIRMHQAPAATGRVGPGCAGCGRHQAMP